MQEALYGPEGFFMRAPARLTLPHQRPIAAVRPRPGPAHPRARRRSWATLTRSTSSTSERAAASCWPICAPLLPGRGPPAARSRSATPSRIGIVGAAAGHRVARQRAARPGPATAATSTTASPSPTPDAAWIQRWWPSPAGTVEIGRSARRGLGTSGRPSRTRAGPHRRLWTFSGYQTQRANPGRFPRRARGRTPPGRQHRPHLPRRDRLRRRGHRAALERDDPARGAALAGSQRRRPPLELAHRDPAGYLRALAEASEAATLTDPDGLGGHWWLLHPLGCAL